MELKEEGETENFASAICRVQVKTLTPPSPPGDPILFFTIQPWKAQWRRAFSLIQIEEKKEGTRVWSRCKTGKCDDKNPLTITKEARNLSPSFSSFCKTSKFY